MRTILVCLTLCRTTSSITIRIPTELGAWIRSYSEVSLRHPKGLTSMIRNFSTCLSAQNVHASCGCFAANASLEVSEVPETNPYPPMRIELAWQIRCSRQSTRTSTARSFSIEPNGRAPTVREDSLYRPASIRKKKRFAGCDICARYEG